MRIQTLIKLIGLAIFGWILFRIDFAHLWDLLKQCRLSSVIFALFLILVSAFFKSMRWHLMLDAQGIGYPLLKCFKHYLAGIFIGVATPGRLGELSRALYVRRDLNVSAGLAFSSVVMDRIYDLYLLLLLGSASAFYFHVAGTWSSLFLVVVGGIFVGPLVLFHPVIGHRLFVALLNRFAKKKFQKIGRIGADDFFNGMKKLVSLKIASFVLLTGIAYGFFFYGGYMLTTSIGINIGFWDALFALALANMISLLPITVAGVGTRDAVFIYVLGIIGVSAAEALAFSMLVLATSYLGVSLVGFFFFLNDSPSKSALSE